MNVIKKVGDEIIIFGFLFIIINLIKRNSILELKRKVYSSINYISLHHKISWMFTSVNLTKKKRRFSSEELFFESIPSKYQGLSGIP